MVYESSTRRIYTSAPRPVISTSYSYSPIVEDGEMCNNLNYYVVALHPMLPGPASPAGPYPVVTKLHRHPHLVLAYTPGISKGHIINPLAIPSVAHRRLVAVSPPPRRSYNGQNCYDMLESGIQGNYGNRIILVRYRPTPPPVPQSKVLYIEDVTDPSGSRLLRRELSPSPSPYYGSPWEITGPSSFIPIPRPMFSFHNIPLRSASEVKEVADLRRLYVRDRNPDVGYSPLNKALLYRMPSPCYVDPTIQQSYFSGRGNLACLSFAGGRPISKRRRFYPDYDDKIGDEIIFRSFYTKLRDAASAGRNAGKRPVYQPIYYSRKTILGEENCPKREPKESKWVERALANEKPYVPRVKPGKQPVATETVIAPPRKESLRLEAKPATPPPVQPVNVTLPGPRKSITEIIREDFPRVENLPEESIVVKRPKSIPREPTPPPPREPTPPPPREPTPPPPREPTPPPPKEPTPPPVEQPKEEASPAEEAPAPVEEPSTPAVEPPQESAPAEEAPAAPEAPVEEAAPSTTPSAEEAPTPEVVETAAPVAEEAPAKSAEASEEVSAPAAPSEQASGDADDASNKGEVEDIQLDDEITLDEVCDVEENDLEIESDDPETSQSVATADQMPQVESPQETEGSASASAEPAATETAAPTEDTAKAPENDQDASPTPVSIVVADIDGPIPPPDEETPAVQEEPLTVEQIQAKAERRRAEFAELLEEHAELVTTVTKLERVAVIVSKSCAEALAQQEHEEQQPPSSTDSQKSK